MAEIHLVAGVALIATNLAAGLWGGYDWVTRNPSVGFWYALRIAQAVIVLQVLLGGLLIFLGHVAVDLHYVYGLAPLFVSLLAEVVRAGAAQQELGELEFRGLSEERQRAIALAIVRRETGIMAVGCLVIFGLALRAAGTTPAF